MSDSRTHRLPAGIVLAGGLGSRMGGGKHLRLLAGRSLLERAIERLSRQVSTVLLSCNDEPPPRLPGLGAVLADSLPGRLGPLAGVLAGLEHLAAHPGLGNRLLSVAVDTPAFPHDLAARLSRALEDANAEIAVAASVSGTHPVFALWPIHLAAALRAQLQGDGDRSVRAFQRRYRVVEVQWDAEPFRNINTEAELQAAASLIDRDAAARESPVR